jgi:nucleoside-diphosphate-sugar epimerase
MICDIVGYQGRIVFDDTKPDGVELRGLSCNMIEGLGWSPEIKIKNGLKDAYDWFLANQSNLRC